MVDHFRHLGIAAQIERAKRFLAESQTLSGEVAFDHLIAGTYAAQAAVEIAKEWAVHDFPKHPALRDAIEGILDTTPYADVIEIVRIHDFHRFGLRLSTGQFALGPIQIRTSGRNGAASVVLHPTGVEFHTSPQSSVAPKRMLQLQGFNVMVDGTWVHLGDALAAFLAALPSKLDEVYALPNPQ